MPDAIVSSPYTGGVVRRRADCGGNTYASLAFPAVAGAKGKAYSVLNSMLSSRLSSTSDDLEVSTFLNRHSDGGLLGFYVQSSSKAGVEDTMAAAINELKQIAASADATEAKFALTLSNFVALEGGDAAVALMAEAATQGLSVTDFADLRDVSNEEVSAAAAAVLKANPSYAVLGETYGIQSYDALRASLQQ
jgi:predicted Zn-dependent peptidase